MPRPKKAGAEAGVMSDMYTLYVQGVPINQIAERFKVSAQEVLEYIEAVEEKRGES